MPSFRGYLVVMLLTSSIFGMAIGERAQASQDSLSAAAVVISQSGTIGGYGLSEPPGYAPAQCNLETDALDGNVGVKPSVNPTIMARYAGQQVGVRTQIYQRLANGTYELYLQFDESFYTPSHAQPTFFVSPWISNLPAGPDYVLAYLFRWYAPNNYTIEGSVVAGYSTYKTTVDGQSYPGLTSVCRSVWAPYATVQPTTGTVNSHVNVQLQRFAKNISANVVWDGTFIGTVAHNGHFTVPAAPKGTHTVQFIYGHWNASATFTVKPRIKIIPDTVSRDQTVNVSLRGFAKQEVVRIRWKKGTGWYQIAQVTTSNTGSANINVKVPKFVPNGATSVRGDGNKGAAAQTNAVSVFGGPFVASTIGTATPTATATATPSSTAAPTEQAPEPTATSTLVSSETPTPKPTTPPEASPVDQPGATATTSSQ